MKSKLFAFFAFGLLASQVNAASYTFGNGAGADANGIADSLGNIFRGGSTAGAALGGTAGGTAAGPGSIAIGIFSTESFGGITNATSLLNTFTQFDGAAGVFSVSGPGGNRGLFALSGAATINTSAGVDTFEGKNIYVLVGNGATLAASTEFLILKSNSLFNAVDDDSPTAIPITFTVANSTLLLGTNTANVTTTGTDATTTAGWRTVALVPEPSTALLGAIGALGLLRRRR